MKFFSHKWVTFLRYGEIFREIAQAGKSFVAKKLFFGFCGYTVSADDLPILVEKRQPLHANKD